MIQGGARHVLYPGNAQGWWPRRQCGIMRWKHMCRKLLWSFLMSWRVVAAALRFVALHLKMINRRCQKKIEASNSGSALKTDDYEFKARFRRFAQYRWLPTQAVCLAVCTMCAHAVFLAAAVRTIVRVIIPCRAPAVSTTPRSTSAIDFFL